MQSMKEAASNAGASAKAGMEKTKASVQEKVDKMKTRDPNEKEMATERKEGRKEQAEQMKQEARAQNATSRQAGGGDARGYDAGRQVGYDNNVNYAGDAAGGHAYTTPGSQDYRSGEYETRNWEVREPNNAAGTRRNTGVADEDDPYYESYR